MIFCFTEKRNDAEYEVQKSFASWSEAKNYATKNKLMLTGLLEKNIPCPKHISQKYENKFK